MTLSKEVVFIYHDLPIFIKKKIYTYLIKKKKIIPFNVFV